MKPFDHAMLKWQAETRRAIMETYPAVFDQVWQAGVREGIRLACGYLKADPPSAIGEELGISGVSDEPNP